MTQTHKEVQGLYWATASILVIALAFGGGGSQYGFTNLIVQLAALIALSFHRQAFFHFWKSAPITTTGLIAATILLPVLHIIPLPAGLWSTLPGREMMAQSLELVGANDWATASVEPLRTLLALTAIITPLALLTIGWSAPRDRLIVIGWFAVALGIVNVALGIPQVLSNSEVGVLYPDNPMPGVLFGTFANRNSTGLFLVGALALALLLPPPPRAERSGLIIKLGCAALLLIAILLTRSRTAIVLSMLPLGLAALRLFAAQFGKGEREGTSSSRVLITAIAAFALVGVGIASLLATAPGRIGAVVERFDTEQEDARVYIWEDGLYSAERYWPVGSGMGTFDDVFQIDESLENMTRRTAGRAHNDYLEVAIEAGVPGLALIAGWLVLLAWLSWRARQSRDRWIAWSGAVILLAIALQSITDYPLRNHAMLAFASYALLILARFGTKRKEAQR